MKWVICYFQGCDLHGRVHVENDPWPGWDRYRCPRCGYWTLCFRDLQIRTWNNSPPPEAPHA